MATESPLIHDGSQTVAAADLSSSQFLCVYVSAARKVNIQTSSGGVVYGVLQNKPTAGQAADVGIFGVTKATSGAAISAGAQLQTDTAGKVITYSSGSKIGVALEASTGTGQIITVSINALSS